MMTNFKVHIPCICIKEIMQHNMFQIILGNILEIRSTTCYIITKTLNFSLKIDIYIPTQLSGNTGRFFCGIIKALSALSRIQGCVNKHTSFVNPPPNTKLFF